MSKCPVCYGGLLENKCRSCDLDLSEIEMLRLKANTYDDIIKHLTQSSCDERRREQIRTKIALKNIKKWAENNFAFLMNARQN